MNISSLVVHVRPEVLTQACAGLEQLPGVEVHARGLDGRLVVTVEDTPETNFSESVMKLHEVEGVLSAAMVYHFSDADLETEEGSHETQ